MKTLLVTLILFISFATFAQSQKNDSNYKHLKIRDIDLKFRGKYTVPDVFHGEQFHFISYHENGIKSREYIQNYGSKYDTSNIWDELGVLSEREIYTDIGYTYIYYYSSGQIFGTGQYNLSFNPVEEITIYDSLNFNKYTSSPCKNYCYFRSGVWKTYHENGRLESSGEYLPMEFEFIAATKDSSGIEIVVKNTSFDFPESGLILITYLKNGRWNYFDSKGILTKREYYSNGLLSN